VLRQLVEQRLGFLQVLRPEALGEPAIDAGRSALGQEKTLVSTTRRNSMAGKRKVQVTGDDTGIFVIVDGVKIAERGPNKKWISLEPGWTVKGSETLTITYNGVRVH
jgi:hypothetical protein